MHKHVNLTLRQLFNPETIFPSCATCTNSQHIESKATRCLFLEDISLLVYEALSPQNQNVKCFKLTNCYWATQMLGCTTHLNLFIR